MQDLCKCGGENVLLFEDHLHDEELRLSILRCPDCYAVRIDYHSYENGKMVDTRFFPSHMTEKKRRERTRRG